MATILQDVKDALNVDHTSFDVELLIHINSAIEVLSQVGITYFDGVYVDNTTEWPPFTSPTLQVDLPARRLSIAFVTLSSKLVFDPYPNTSVQKSLADHVQEIKVRCMHLDAIE